MEGSGYVDLFATKGIEYLFVIGFLFAFVIYWKFLSRPLQPVRQSSARRRGLTPLSEWFHLPEGFYYHQGHTWAMPEGKNLVRIGIDDFAQQLLGEASSVEIPGIGTRIEQGEKGWKVWVNSKPIDLLFPVDGEILEINEEVLKSPALINKDPYGKGWIMRVKVPKMESNLKNLLSGRLAWAWMRETVDVLQQRMAGDLGLALQDGGVPVAGIARNLSPDRWDEIAREFLLSR